MTIHIGTLYEYDFAVQLDENPLVPTYLHHFGLLISLPFNTFAIERLTHEPQYFF